MRPSQTFHNSVSELKDSKGARRHFAYKDMIIVASVEETKGRRWTHWNIDVEKEGSLSFLKVQRERRKKRSNEEGINEQYVVTSQGMAKVELPEEKERNQMDVVEEWSE